MRKWSQLPPVELSRTSFRYEFRALQLRAHRRHSLNFEMKAEPRLESSRPRSDSFLVRSFVNEAAQARALASSID